MSSPRLLRQIEFILEIDKLKTVLRRTYLLDQSRHENSAEHSWHLAMLALLLAEHANEPVDPFKIVRMALIHDIVEIDAGDTLVYDDTRAAAKTEREQRAAERLFGLLPKDQAKEFRSLWEEFEARQTPEARFAAAIDRLIPILHNLHTSGRTWSEHGVTGSRVLARNQHMEQGSRELWNFARAKIEKAIGNGLLAP